MLTKVYLEGAMGRNFGREWTLDINTPIEALQLIQANIPAFGQWIRDNAKRYAKCMIICKYADGRTEALDEKTMLMHKEPKEIHFVPWVEGAGKAFQYIVGAAMMIIGAICYWMPGASQACMSAGLSLMVAGGGMLVSAIVTAIMGRVRKDEDDSGTSYYFNGAQNTTAQGVPVPLIFGRCKVGSAVISSSINTSDTGETPKGKPGIVEVAKNMKGETA